MKRNTAKNKIRLVEQIFIFAFITLYTLAAALVSLHRYWQYNAFWYDFGIFEETVWKLSRLQLPIILNLHPPQGRLVWIDHFNPSSVILTPFYWITDRAEIILIAQALFVGLSAGIAYFISLKTIKNGLVRTSLIVSYLGFVGLQNALFTDVHNIVFAVLPLMLATWAIYNKKWKLFWLFLLLVLGFQENMAAIGVGLGLFLILRKERNLKIGLLTIVLSLLWGIFTIKLIIPFLKGASYSYQPFMPVVWHEWITRFFLPANMKLKSILVTLATFGFLPIGSISTAPLIIEHYLERFVLNAAGTRWDLGFHYNALLSPIMFLASVEVIRRLQINKKINKLLPLWGLLTIFIVIFLHRFYLHGPLMLATHPIFYEHTKRSKFMSDFTSAIPKDGLLMTQNNIATHFTHRKTILLNKQYDKIQPDVIAVDVRAGQNANNFFPLTPSDSQSLVASISADPNYSKNIFTNDQLIFMRK